MQAMIEKMIARRVRGGANEQQSRDLLAEHLRTAGQGTMAAILCYDNFASEAMADKFVAAHFA